MRGLRVLELGSGCGLVGIAAGLLGAKQVVMTDLEYALPLMRDNVALNESAWIDRKDPRTTRLNCKICDWFHPPPANLLMGSTDVNTTHPDVILVADCVWLSSLVAPLLQTLKKYTKESTQVIITYQQRGRETHDEFWEGIHSIFKKVKEIDTESAGVAKPDVFHVLLCSGRHDA